MPFKTPPCPPSLKPIQNYMKIAEEHDARDLAVSYWCRMYAVQKGMIIDSTSNEAKHYFNTIMDWLEKQKIENADNEIITHDIPAEAHVENYALKLFLWADSKDRAGTFNKNVVKAFYTSGILFDVLETFGPVSEEILKNRKYAKWKAAYIHTCLKEGQIPIPGPALDETVMDEPGPSNWILEDEPVPAKEKCPSEPPPKPSTDVTSLDSSAASTGISLTAEKIDKAQKYCKFAVSALDYEDVSTAVDYLRRGLNILQTGEET